MAAGQAEAAARVALAIPVDGCWIATSCTLRLSALPPARMSREAPLVVSRSPDLAIRNVSADGDGWLITVIPFRAGDVPWPVISTPLFSATGEWVSEPLPRGSLRVQQRVHPSATELADVEAMPAPRWSIRELAAGLIALLVVVAAILVLRRIAVMFIAELQRRLLRPRARWQARRALGRLRRHIKRRPPEETYTGLVSSLRRLLIPRLGRRAISATSAQLIDLLARDGVDDGVRARLHPLLTLADRVRFGGRATTLQEMSRDIRLARRIVRELDRVPPREDRR